MKPDILKETYSLVLLLRLNMNKNKCLIMEVRCLKIVEFISNYLLTIS